MDHKSSWGRALIFPKASSPKFHSEILKKRWKVWIKERSPWMLSTSPRDIDNPNSSFINRPMVCGTWCTNSLKALDVIGIYWLENWDALSPPELRVPHGGGTLSCPLFAVLPFTDATSHPLYQSIRFTLALSPTLKLHRESKILIWRHNVLVFS